MSLAEYLKQAGLSCSAFGAKCNPPVDRTIIWRYAKRLMRPKADKVAAIERASGFRVRAEDL